MVFPLVIVFEMCGIGLVLNHAKMFLLASLEVEQNSVEAGFAITEFHVHIQQEHINISRCQSDGIYHTDKQHGLDNAGFDLLRLLGLSGA